MSCHIKKYRKQGKNITNSRKHFVVVQKQLEDCFLERFQSKAFVGIVEEIDCSPKQRECGL